MSTSKTFLFEKCFLQFKMGFPYSDMEFITRFPYSEMVLSALFLHYFRGLEMGFPAFKGAFLTGTFPKARLIVEINQNIRNLQS